MYRHKGMYADKCVRCLRDFSVLVCVPQAEVEWAVWVWVCWWGPTVR